MSTDHNFRRERRAEADSNRGPSAYQPNALPLGQSGSRQPQWLITYTSTSSLSLLDLGSAAMLFRFYYLLNQLNETCACCMFKRLYYQHFIFSPVARTSDPSEVKITQSAKMVLSQTSGYIQYSLRMVSSQTSGSIQYSLRMVSSQTSGCIQYSQRMVSSQTSGCIQYSQRMVLNLSQCHERSKSL